MKINEIYLLETVLVLIQFLTADAINCFQCDYAEPGCADLIKTDTSSPYYMPCKIANSTAFCRKTTQTILFTEEKRITRECGWLTVKPNHDKCFKYDTDHKFDTSCQCYQDGCNGAFIFLPRTFLVTVVTSLVLFKLF